MSAMLPPPAAEDYGNIEVPLGNESRTDICDELDKVEKKDKSTLGAQTL